MIILLILLALVSLVLLAIPVLTIVNGAYLLLRGDFTMPEGHFMLALGVWMTLAVILYWLYRAFGKEEGSEANVGWYFCDCDGVCTACLVCSLGCSRRISNHLW